MCVVVFLAVLVFWFVCSFCMFRFFPLSCSSLSDHDWTLLFQLMIFGCGLKGLIRFTLHLYIHLVFFLISLCRFFLVVHTRFCPVLTCLHSFLICSTLLFLLVPRVSWLRARGYLPSATDWLRGTRDPYLRNLYNNNNCIIYQPLYSFNHT